MHDVTLKTVTSCLATPSGDITGLAYSRLLAGWSGGSKPRAPPFSAWLIRMTSEAPDPKAKLGRGPWHFGKG